MSLSAYFSLHFSPETMKKKIGVCVSGWLGRNIVFLLKCQGTKNVIPVSAVCLVLSSARPLNSRRYQFVQPAAHHCRLLDYGDFLPLGLGVSDA
jgi:hypothetical protein